MPRWTASAAGSGAWPALRPTGRGRRGRGAARGGGGRGGGRVTVQRSVAVAELQSPGGGFQPFLPAGLAPVEKVGVGGVAGRDGAVVGGGVAVGGVPMAVCSLSGRELAFRAPALREGAAMAGLERIGVVGGDATSMHAHLGPLQTVLGALGAGSMFVTADMGIGHASERLHRRRVGGRPELQRMEQSIEFTGGAGVRNVRRLDGRRGEIVRGTYRGTVQAEITGGVVVGSGGRPRLDGASAGGAGRGGGTLTVPALLTVGTSVSSGTALTVRGEVSAGSLTLAGAMDAGGELDAGHLVSNGDISVVGGLAARRLVASQSVDAGTRLIAHEATVSGSATAGGALRTGSFSATGSVGVTGELGSSGPVTSSGTVTGGSVSTGGRVIGHSGSFGSISVGSCDGCGPTL